MAGHAAGADGSGAGRADRADSAEEWLGFRQVVDVLDFKNLLWIASLHAADHGDADIVQGADLVWQHHVEQRMGPANQLVIGLDVSLAGSGPHKAGGGSCRRF